MSRCRSCDKIMDELDMAQPDVFTGEHEDLCRRCKSLVHKAASEEELTDWELFTELPEDALADEFIDREDFDDLESF